MCVEVAATHEACLCRVRMDPTENHQILAVHIVEEVAFVDSFTSIRCAFLIWYDQFRDEEGIRNKRTAKNSTRLQIRASVRLCNREKGVT